jgi:hypothetical protein
VGYPTSPVNLKNSRRNPMKFDAKTQKPKSAVQPQAGANWEDCIVEELSDEAAATVSGGRVYRVMTSEDIRNIDWSIGIG